MATPNREDVGAVVAGKIDAWMRGAVEVSTGRGEDLARRIIGLARDHGIPAMDMWDLVVELRLVERERGRSEGFAAGFRDVHPDAWRARVRAEPAEMPEPAVEGGVPVDPFGTEPMQLDGLP